MLPLDSRLDTTVEVTTDSAVAIEKSRLDGRNTAQLICLAQRQPSASEWIVTVLSDRKWLSFWQTSVLKPAQLADKNRAITKCPTNNAKQQRPQVSADTRSRQLRSAARNDLPIPRTRTASYGLRSFAVSGLTCWNSLPPQLKSVSLTLQQFCDRLKLFSRSYASALPPWLCH